MFAIGQGIVLCIFNQGKFGDFIAVAFCDGNHAQQSPVEVILLDFLQFAVFIYNIVIRISFLHLCDDITAVNVAYRFFEFAAGIIVNFYQLVAIPCPVLNQDIIEHCPSHSIHLHLHCLVYLRQFLSGVELPLAHFGGGGVSFFVLLAGSGKQRHGYDC